MIALASFIHIDARAHKHMALNEFERIRDQVATSEDQTDWSEKRKAEYSRQVDAARHLRYSGFPPAILRFRFSIRRATSHSTEARAMSRARHYPAPQAT